MKLPVEMSYNGKLEVVITRKGNELNIPVKPNSYKTLIILSESRYTRGREELGMEDKMAAQTRRLEDLPASFSHSPVSPIKKWGHALPSCPAGAFYSLTPSFSGLQAESIAVFEVSPFPGHMILAGSSGTDKVWVKAWWFVQTPSHLFVSRSAERTPRAWWVPWWC